MLHIGIFPICCKIFYAAKAWVQYESRDLQGLTGDKKVTLRDLESIMREPFSHLTMLKTIQILLTIIAYYDFEF